MERALDLFAPLADLPGVAEAVGESRKAVDAVLWPRNLGGDGPALAVSSRVHGAQASAAVDGVDFAIEGWWSGDVWEDSPMGRIAAGVWRGYRELPALVEVWASAPLQALARLHAVVAADVEPAAELGRPAYVAAARQYLGGTPEGVTAWLTYFAEVVAMGAAAAAEILVGIRAKGLGKGAGVE